MLPLSYRPNKMLLKIFLSYTLTFAIVELGSKICLGIDGLMISNLLGDAAMAAHGLTSPYGTMLHIISAVIVTGSQAMLTRAIGKGDKQEVNAVFSVSLEISLVLSLLVTGLLYLFNGTICTLLGADGKDAEFRQLLTDYNLGFFGVVPSLIMCPVLSAMAALDGGKRYVTFSTLVLSAADVALNYLFAGPMQLGMFGVGLSSTIAQLLAVLTVAPALYRKGSMFRFVPTRFSAEAVLTMLKTGLPKLTRKVCTTVKKIGMNRLALIAGGVGVLSAVSVRNVVYDLVMSLSVGISGALLLMGQVFYSEEDEVSLKQTAAAAMLLLLVGMGGISLVLFAAAPWLLPFFGLSPANAAAAVSALRYTAGSLILISLNEMIFDYLQAVRRYRASHVLIAFQRLTILPVAYVLIRFFGTRGLFMAYICGEIPVTLGYLLTAWLANRRSSRGFFSAVLCIPARFADMAANTLDIDLTEQEQVAELSVRVENFCLSHGIDRRRAMHAALCTEEMASNILTHGFPKDSAKHFCSIRIAASPDNLVLRFRDDCVYFDLKERYACISGRDDPCSNIGIKVVHEIAKDIRYSHVLNLNTLVITL